MKYVKTFTDFEEDMEFLSDAECGRLFRAILRYGRTEELPDLKGNERFLWSGAKKVIDRQREGYLKKVASADRARQTRANNSDSNLINSEIRNKKLMSDENNMKSAQDKDIRHKTKTEDKDKDKDSSAVTPADDIAQVMRAWDKACGISSPAECEIIADLLDSYGKDNMLYAIQQAVEHKAPTVAYIRAVLTKPKRTSDDEARRNFEEWLADEQD